MGAGYKMRYNRRGYDEAGTSRNMLARRFLTLLLTLTLCSLPAVAAQRGLETEPLFFGQVIVNDNTSVRSCVITPLGVETCDFGLTLLQHGQRGVYRLTGFDPNTQLGAVIDTASPLANSRDATLIDISDFKLDPAIDVTPQTPDASGNMTLKIGATLSTRANAAYPVTPFRGTYRLTITY